MQKRPVNAKNAAQASGGYSQAIEVQNASRVLYVSGQIPEAMDGHVPDGFDAQARMVWAHIQAQLQAANMGVENIVKVTSFLARREDREANSRVRQAVLGNVDYALTVVICEIYDEAWLLEIEVIAAG